MSIHALTGAAWLILQLLAQKCVCLKSVLKAPLKYSHALPHTHVHANETSNLRSAQLILAGTTVRTARCGVTAFSAKGAGAYSPKAAADSGHLACDVLPQNSLPKRDHSPQIFSRGAAGWRLR